MLSMWTSHSGKWKARPRYDLRTGFQCYLNTQQEIFVRRSYRANERRIEQDWENARNNFQAVKKYLPKCASLRGMGDLLWLDTRTRPSFRDDMESTFNRGRNPTYYARCRVSQVRENNTRESGEFKIKYRAWSVSSDVWQTYGRRKFSNKMHAGGIDFARKMKKIENKWEKVLT